MPCPPSNLRILPDVRDDIANIQQHNPDHAEDILQKIADWSEHIHWGRAPQEILTYLIGLDTYDFYRECVGSAGHRVIYEISNDVMTTVSVLPKGDDMYDLSNLQRRMNRT